MKRLNNRGFAITAVLYGLLILFLLLFLGMIRILNTERKRMAKISDEIDNSIVNMERIDISSNNVIYYGDIYVTPYRGKYVFYINGDTSKEYYMYLPIYSIVSISDDSVDEDVDAVGISNSKIMDTNSTNQGKIVKSNFLSNSKLMAKLRSGKISVTSGTSQSEISESSFLANGNLMNDSGISQANSDIFSITITGVYTSVREVSGDTP